MKPTQPYSQFHKLGKFTVNLSEFSINITKVFKKKNSSNYFVKVNTRPPPPPGPGITCDEWITLNVWRKPYLQHVQAAVGIEAPPSPSLPIPVTPIWALLDPEPIWTHHNNVLDYSAVKVCQKYFIRLHLGLLECKYLKTMQDVTSLFFWYFKTIYIQSVATCAI